MNSERRFLRNLPRWSWNWWSVQKNKNKEKKACKLFNLSLIWENMKKFTRRHAYFIEWNKLKWLKNRTKNGKMNSSMCVVFYFSSFVLDFMILMFSDRDASVPVVFFVNHAASSLWHCDSWYFLQYTQYIVSLSIYLSINNNKCLQRYIRLSEFDASTSHITSSVMIAILWKI